MNENSLRRELAGRFAELLEQNNAAVSFLQFLVEDSNNSGRRNSDLWSGPFAALAEDFSSLRGVESSKASVGIWEEEAEGSREFVRARKHIDLWRFCADVERIEKKGERKRVVLMGESVARGFFYDPVFCPARVLEQQISTSVEPIEVIDLAQSNCDPWWLSKVAASTLLLEPDAVVIFAGNNWRAGALANTSLDSFVRDGALITEQRGFATLLEKQHRRLEDFAARLVEQLVSSVTRAGVPVIFVIPEINVADWSNALAGALDVPLMSAQDTQNWVSAYQDAVAALDRAEFAEAERFSCKAIDYDGGASSASLDLLARARSGQGKNNRDVYSALRQSREVIDDTSVVPGVFRNVADAIRRVGPQVGASVVDLPQVFSDYYEQDIPGRRQFLDFCHLTSEGIRVAMAATTGKLLPILFDKQADLRELIEIVTPPAPEHEAWSHVLAGIHNAHWGQSPELCRYHFRRAKEYDPEIAKSGIPLVYETYRRKIPSILLRSFDQLVQNEIAEVCLVGYSPLARGTIQELPLLTAISSAFPEFDDISPDPDFSLGKVSQIDLLQSQWNELTDRNRWYRRAYSAAYSIKTGFSFSSASSQDLSIDITVRIPGAAETGDIAIEVNGNSVETVKAKDEWTSSRITVKAKHVNPGANRLSVIWPNVLRNDRRPRVRSDFESGKTVDIRTHFGHIHDLRVSVPS